MQVFGGGAKEEQSEAASEAVSDEMSAAMLNYMPLRGITSFTGGSIGYDDLQKIADEINK
jgi:hypothetical protein